MKRYYIASLLFAAVIASLFLFPMSASSVTSFQDRVQTATKATDPGVRSGASAGNALPGVKGPSLKLFNASKDEFEDVEDVPEDGLGPTMNLDSCAGCHSQPATGGSSPKVNPQVEFATALNADNRVPRFVTKYGPVREARFVKNPDGSPDGGVHALFTIAGRDDAPGCVLAQPDFERQLGNNNVIFRIPTPVFGAGLIEQIPDSAILANQAANATTKRTLGIRGRPNIVLSGNAVTGQPNHNGNDGTIARFGWKAQNKSLLLFSGEAYNVEMGITNELFQTERDETSKCQFAATPNNATDADAASPVDAVVAIEKFAFFMRFLAPPTPSTTMPGGSTAINKGRTVFSNVGCNLCHTPTLMTGNSSSPLLKNQAVNLYSDLLLHDMGPGLADHVSQGQASGSEFRSAPLWGLGQRIFFLHDGRTSDLLAAIAAHQSGSSRNGDASEANAVVQKFNDLSEDSKQNLLYFLRSL